MMSCIITAIICLIVGACLGLFVFAMCFMSSVEDKMREDDYYKFLAEQDKKKGGDN